MSADVIVYASGLVFTSACASEDSTREQIEEAVNAEVPTGISSSWAIHDGPFASGAPNPSPCESHPDRLHWLLNC